MRTITSVGALIERFEDSILDDQHGVLYRYRQSPHSKRVRDEGPSILKEVAEHLDQLPSRMDIHEKSKEELWYAWRLLLADMALAYGLRDMPKSEDVGAWVAWIRAVSMR